jgi:hypothetical protein
MAYENPNQEAVDRLVAFLKAAPADEAAATVINNIVNWAMPFVPSTDKLAMLAQGPSASAPPKGGRIVQHKPQPSFPPNAGAVAAGSGVAPGGKSLGSQAETGAGEAKRDEELAKTGTSTSGDSGTEKPDHTPKTADNALQDRTVGHDASIGTASGVATGREGIRRDTGTDHPTSPTQPASTGNAGAKAAEQGVKDADKK